MRAIQERLRPPGTTLALTLVSLAVLGILLVLPNLGPTLTGSPAVSAWHGRVTAILDPHRPDPSGAAGGYLPDARVLLLEGPRAGVEVEAYRQGPGGQQDSNAYRVGEDVVVTSTGNPDGTTFLAIADRWRLPQLVLLTGLFVLAVVAVGGWRGVRALFGLALTVAILLKVLIPLLVAGVPPIPVAVVVATVLTMLVIGLTEGGGRAAVAAILGTAAALALTAILAATVTAAAGFTNTLGSELVGMSLPNGEGLDLRGMLLAAFMIGSIGVLDDVTVTQAIAVDELARVGVRGRELYRSAFGIGRSHIAATVNTLFLAYAGASLPLLIFVVVGNQPSTLLINGETVAIEIVRTLVGSLGIVAAVPITTLIAAWLAGGGEPAESANDTARTATARTDRRRGQRSPLIALLGGLAALSVVTVAAALVLGPLTSNGPRMPLAPDQFGGSPGRSPTATAVAPSASAGALASEPVGSAATGPGPADGPVFAAGDEIPLFGPTGAQAGTVTVVTVDPLPSVTGSLTLDVQFRYVAVSRMAIDPAAWVARSTDGDRVPGTVPAGRAGHPPLPAEAAPGRSTTGWLEFSLAGTPVSVWLDYDLAGTSLFAVPLY